MSLSHFDEVYDICCELCDPMDERTEPIPFVTRRKEVKPLPVFQQELTEEDLYEKV